MYERFRMIFFKNVLDIGIWDAKELASRGTLFYLANFSDLTPYMRHFDNILSGIWPLAECW